MEDIEIKEVETLASIIKVNNIINNEYITIQKSEIVDAEIKKHQHYKYLIKIEQSNHY